MTKVSLGKQESRYLEYAIFFTTKKLKTMKQMKMVLSLAMLFFASAVFGQKELTVSAIKAGTVLTDGDIGFLSAVSNATLDASRGAAKKTATISNKTYAAGETLSAADAEAINKAIKDYQKNYKAPEASRGAGLCYYWYYYCDGYGYCYYYKVWYYC